MAKNTLSQTEIQAATILRELEKVPDDEKLERLAECLKAVRIAAKPLPGAILPPGHAQAMLDDYEVVITGNDPMKHFVDHPVPWEHFGSALRHACALESILADAIHSGELDAWTAGWNAAVEATIHHIRNFGITDAMQALKR